MHLPHLLFRRKTNATNATIRERATKSSLFLMNSLRTVRDCVYFTVMRIYFLDHHWRAVKNESAFADTGGARGRMEMLTPSSLTPFVGVCTPSAVRIFYVWVGVLSYFTRVLAFDRISFPLLAV